MIFDVSNTISAYFLKQPRPPVKIKTARMLKYDVNEPGYVLVRQSFSGAWERSYIRNNKSLPKEIHFKKNYNEPVPLKKSKIQHLLNLSKYIKKPENLDFYKNILNKMPSNIDPVEDDVEMDNDDNSSGTSDVE